MASDKNPVEPKPAADDTFLRERLPRYGVEKLISTIALLASLAWAANALGAEPAGDCERCTQAQYYAVALGEAQAIGLHGPHIYVYVYDLSGNKLVKYQVDAEPASGGWTYVLNLDTATEPEQAAFDVQRSAIAANGGNITWFGHVNASQRGFPYPNESAFNVVLTSAEIMGIGNWILFDGSSNVMLNDLGLTTVSLANSAATVLLKTDIVSMQITVTFLDGTYVVLTWHAGTSNVVMTDARDRNNNVIPIPPSKSAQHYVFPHGGTGVFRNYMNTNYGLNLPDVPTCVNGYLSCGTVHGGDGSTFTCAWFTCGPPQ